MITALVVCAALGLDWLLGEPKRFHPLVGFGHLADRVEAYCYRNSVGAGLLALSVTLSVGVLPFLALALFAPGWLAPLVGIAVLYLAIGWRSLHDHAAQVSEALTKGEMAEARAQTRKLVSRDTQVLDASALAGATTESVLENGNDAVFGALFWFVLAGVPGVVLYRLSNTLDAMWGYPNPRYGRFGRIAARLDDVLNWPPARLTALSYALVGHTRAALWCWRDQGRTWKSPNAGAVMAAGAGSLGVVLGGSAAYAGVAQSRPPLGCGRPPTAADIASAQRLVTRAVGLWILVIGVGGLTIHYGV